MKQTVVLAVGQQGPQGIQGINGSGAASFLLEAGEDIIKGQPVSSSIGIAMLADAVNAYRVAGLAGSDALETFATEIVVTGSITKLDWTDVTGTVSLTPGAPYFVSTVTGKLSTLAPTTGYVIRVGSAVTTDTLLIALQEPILLS